jgi:class 3 adenylate cyclase
MTPDAIAEAQHALDQAGAELMRADDALARVERVVGATLRDAVTFLRADLQHSQRRVGAMTQHLRTATDRQT